MYWTYLIALFGPPALSRTIAFAVRPNFQWPWGQRAWLLQTSAGLVIVVSTSIAWAAFVGNQDAFSKFWLAALATATLVGIAVFGIGLGYRLRIELRIRGVSAELGPAAAVYVAARIETMGTNKPRGLRAPQGTDVVDLPENALKTLPESRVEALALQLIRWVTSATPWVAEIALVDNETAAVSLTRNGGSLDSRLIFRSTLGLDNRLPTGSTDTASAIYTRDLLTAASAFIILRLSTCYRMLRDGLCGATHWRSLACQVLAGTPPWQGDESAAIELYARAVDKDPENLNAWLGYFLERLESSCRDSEDWEMYTDGLEMLRNKLEALKRPEIDPGFDAFRLRLFYNSAAANINRWLELGNRTGGQGKQMIQRAGDHSEQLATLTKKMTSCDNGGKQGTAAFVVKITKKLTGYNKEGKRGIAAFAHEMKPHAEAISSQVSEIENKYGWSNPNSNSPDQVNAADKWTTKDLVSLQAYYSRACLQAGQGKKDLAFKNLKLALGMRNLRDDSLIDPSFVNLRKDPRFSALVDGGNQDLSRLGVFSPYVEELKRDGIRFASELLARNSKEDGDLASSLEVPLSTVRWMRGVCTLVETCPKREAAISWTNLITAEGIDDKEELRSQVRSNMKGLREVLTRRIRMTGLGTAPPSDSQLRRWSSTSIIGGRSLAKIKDLFRMILGVCVSR